MCLAVKHHNHEVDQHSNCTCYLKSQHGSLFCAKINPFRKKVVQTFSVSLFHRGHEVADHNLTSRNIVCVKSRNPFQKARSPTRYAAEGDLQTVDGPSALRDPASWKNLL